MGFLQLTQRCRRSLLVLLPLGRGLRRLRGQRFLRFPLLYCLCQFGLCLPLLLHRRCRGLRRPFSLSLALLALLLGRLRRSLCLLQLALRCSRRLLQRVALFLCRLQLRCQGVLLLGLFPYRVGDLVLRLLLVFGRLSRGCRCRLCSCLTFLALRFSVRRRLLGFFQRVLRCCFSRLGFLQLVQSFCGCRLVLLFTACGLRRLRGERFLFLPVLERLGRLCLRLLFRFQRSCRICLCFLLPFFRLLQRHLTLTGLVPCLGRCWRRWRRNSRPVLLVLLPPGERGRRSADRSRRCRWPWRRWCRRRCWRRCRRR